MKYITRLFLLLLIGINLFRCVPITVRPDVEDRVQKSQFIFLGTIIELNAATIPSIQDASRTAIVKVDEVYRAPKTLGDYTGQEITVVLKKPQRAEVDQQLVFFTKGWTYGKSIAVIEVSNLRFEDDPTKLREEIIQTVQMLPDRNLQKHLARADLVIVGRVSEIREVNNLEQRQATSEHHPQWQEAVIEIESVEKGGYTQENIIILFPSSYDVMWIQSPKFRFNQEGIWILQTNRIPEQKRVIFTALRPWDFHSKNQLVRIRKLLKGL